MKGISRIEECRRACGMTQEDLAALLKCSDTTIYRWESGNGKSLPDAKELTVIATATKTSVAYLVHETNDRRPMAEVIAELEDLRAKVKATNVTVGEVHHVSGDVNTGNNEVTVMQPSENTLSNSGAKGRSPWWADVLSKAYKMEDMDHVSAAEAARALRLASDVLERSAGLNKNYT